MSHTSFGTHLQPKSWTDHQISLDVAEIVRSRVEVHRACKMMDKSQQSKISPIRKVIGTDEKPCFHRLQLSERKDRQFRFSVHGDQPSLAIFFSSICGLYLRSKWGVPFNTRVSQNGTQVAHVKAAACKIFMSFTLTNPNLWDASK